MTSRQCELLSMVADERRRQDKKWGEQNHSDFKWCAILTEEVGEAAKAALDGDDDLHLKMELIQVAASALAWIECMERNAERQDH